MTIMKKPLLSSSFFSFPKLLLWSLPLGLFLVSTWLAGGLNKDKLMLLVWKTEEVVVEKVCLVLEISRGVQDVYLVESYAFSVR